MTIVLRYICFNTLFFGVLFSCLASAQVTSLDQIAAEMDKNLVAPCCWAKTLDQDFSSEAHYVKSKVRNQLAAGMKPDQIYAGLVEEFGERILSKPKKSGFNLFVWFFPAVFLCLGAIFLYFRLKNYESPSNAETSQMEDTSRDIAEEDQKYIDAIDKELYR